MNNNQYPKSLPVFFSTELWERYGFYVIQTLLALYLALHFNWPDTKIYSLVGSFTALTYLSPFIGGWIADQYLGQKNAILLGGCILFFSYISLSLSHHIPSLIKALASITIGTGLLKPNISCLLGNQYPPHSERREHGFTIFYLGITTGIILGTTLPSIFQNIFGWQLAFLSAAIGMIFSLISFSAGIIHFKIVDYNPKPLKISELLITSGVLIVLWPLFGYILLHQTFANLIFPLISLFSLGYLVSSFFKEPQEQAKKNMVILCLCSISVMFWAFYFQMFMCLVLFIKRLVQAKLFGILFPPPYYVAFESIGMIGIGVVLTQIKTHSATLKTEIQSIATKFSISMCCLLCTYLIITLICLFHTSQQLISPLLLLPAYLLISLAELLLSPVGISAISLLSARKNVSTMMGIFFVSLGLGGYLSGQLAKLTAIPQNLTQLDQIRHLYTLGFSKILMILFCCLIITLILRKIIHQYIK